MKRTAPERPKKYTSLYSHRCYIQGFPHYLRNSMNELPNSVDTETRSLWRSSIRRRCPFVTTVIVVVLNFGSGCRNKTFTKKREKKTPIESRGLKGPLMYCGFSSLSFGIIGPKMGIFFLFYFPPSF